MLVFCGCFKGTFDQLEAYIAAGEDEHKASRIFAMNTLRALIDFQQ